MTELETRNTGADLNVAPPSLPQTDSVVQLQEWAAELSAARQLAQVLAASSFLPMALRKASNGALKNPEDLTYDAAAVILAGKSVGLDPMQSVQNIFPVHGMPSMYARTMVALVIAAGHEAKRTQASNDSVTYTVRRKGDKDWQEFTWDIARARKAGYTTNKKYESDPIAMLGAKAAAEACRTVFPDILLGMAYSAEEIELEDMGETEPEAKPASASSRLAAAAAQPATSAPAKSRPKASELAAPAAAQPEPQQSEPAPQETPTEEPAPEPCTAEQFTGIMGALDAAGYKTKAAKMEAVKDMLGRGIRGPGDLTADEAERLIAEFGDMAETVNTSTGEVTEPKDADQAWLDGQSA